MSAAGKLFQLFLIWKFLLCFWFYTGYKILVIFSLFSELHCLQASVISINKFIVIPIFLPLSITCFFLWLLLRFFSLLQIFISFIIVFFCIVFLVDYCASWDLLSFLDFFFLILIKNFFWLHCVTYRILGPWPVIEPTESKLLDHPSREFLDLWV